MTLFTKVYSWVMIIMGVLAMISSATSGDGDAFYALLGGIMFALGGGMTLLVIKKLEQRVKRLRRALNPRN